MIPLSISPVIYNVLDSMHDGFFMVAPDGTIIMANEALLRMTGYARREIVGQPCTIFCCDECDKELQQGGEHWCQLFASGKTVRQHCHIFTKDGKCLKVLKSSTVIRDEQGEILASVANVADISDLIVAEQRIAQLHERLQDSEDFCGMVGRSPAMQRLFSLVEKAALSDSSAIIYGESGTGKELVAHAIHCLGRRRARPFIKINCAAFNESLLESEIFGHVRGAFTGAERHRIGRLEEADDGDLFLDEVGDIPMATQTKLLRVLETRQFERVGENKPIPMGARLISATNQDLQRLMRQGRIRQDFFYRINVVPVHVPPLRERCEDIPLLVDFFVRQMRQKTRCDIAGITPEALEFLVQHDWPGNVRELRSLLEYAFVVCSRGYIGIEHLRPSHPGQAAASRPLPATPTASLDTPGPMFLTEPDYSAAEKAQRDELIAMLRRTKGNKSAAARQLGVTRMTILNRLRKYGIDLQSILRT